MKEENCLNNKRKCKDYLKQNCPAVCPYAESPRAEKDKVKVLLERTGEFR